ncbi:MAG: hypothetical protein [Bacteriophage sp.]|nr:MAG: hypothetical protein [Bacteriophage sp.]
MISKESFLKKIRVLGKQYANNTILDSENHQDAVNAVISDYLQGAEDAYSTFRIYDKKRFCDSLRNILNYYKNLEELENVLNCVLIESPIGESITFIITDLIRSLANDDENTVEDIEWWLYEDVEKEWTINNEIVKVETPEQLYDALKKLNRV